MNSLTIPESNQVYVVIGGKIATGRVIDLAARLALHGPLILLDCGNRANPLPLVRELRRLSADPAKALAGIRTARAFTCYQVAALMETAANQPVQLPVLIVDMLATFYDENVTYREAQRLLEQSLKWVKQMRQSAPVVISTQLPHAAFPERAAFVKMVYELADLIWVEDTPLMQGPKQSSLLE